MATFTYPEAAELEAIAQEVLPVLTLADPIFAFFPLEQRDTTLLMWELRDNFTGLQQARGLNGQPAKVTRIGLKQYQAPPGVYGEFVDIDEKELTERRQIGTFGTPIDVADLVREAQDQLLSRRIDRIRYILWTLATTGTFSVPGPNGAIVHTDAFPLQAMTPSPAWSNPTTAHPLADFRAAKLLGRGHGVNFGAGATAFMNQVTFNRLIANTNAADLGGRRTTGLATIENLNDVNTLLVGDGLPRIVIDDDGYFDDTGTFTPFLAEDTVTVFGQRPAGQRLGAYRLVRNANNPGMAPGAYMKVVDHTDEVPRSIQVHDGHNGGPVIYYPASILVMNV